MAYPYVLLVVDLFDADPVSEELKFGNDMLAFETGYPRDRAGSAYFFSAAAESGRLTQAVLAALLDESSVEGASVSRLRLDVEKRMQGRLQSEQEGDEFVIALPLGRGVTA